MDVDDNPLTLNSFEIDEYFDSALSKMYQKDFSDYSLNDCSNPETGNQLNLLKTDLKESQSNPELSDEITAFLSQNEDLLNEIESFSPVSESINNDLNFSNTEENSREVLEKNGLMFTNREQNAETASFNNDLPVDIENMKKIILERINQFVSETIRKSELEKQINETVESNLIKKIKDKAIAKRLNGSKRAPNPARLKSKIELYKSNISIEFDKIQEGFRRKIKMFLDDFDSFKRFISDNKAKIEIELIEKYHQCENIDMIKDMKAYFEHSFRRIDDESFLKKLFNVFTQIESGLIDQNASPHQNYISKLNTDYKKMAKHFTKDNLSYFEINQNENNKTYEDKIIDEFSNKENEKTFSEGINDIVFTLEANRQNTIGSKFEMHYFDGHLLNKTILNLIDDLIIKLQYDILFIACFIVKRRSILKIYIFILKQKVFVEKIRNCLIEATDKNSFTDQKIDEMINDSTEGFKFFEKNLTISRIYANFFQNTYNLEDNASFENFSFVVVTRLKILNSLFLQLKKILKPTIKGNFPYLGDDLPYFLLMTFLDPEKLKQ